MNRKKYIQPSTEVISMSITQMVCVSLNSGTPTSGLGPTKPGYGGENNDDVIVVEAGTKSREAWGGSLYSDTGLW